MFESPALPPSNVAARRLGCTPVPSYNQRERRSRYKEQKAGRLGVESGECRRHEQHYPKCSSTSHWVFRSFKVKMSCIPASHSMSTILSQVESQLEESPAQRRGSKAYQIFPEANVNEDSDLSSYPEDFLYRRERLPSIVVEPTEHSELESRELHWPTGCLMSNSVEEEDSSADHTEGSVDGEQQEDMGTEEG
ncbi:protein LBH-like [Micropterus dolomieu]|uniref:protein LBH-like n=1 Tax=Micropterus dolomieu TaxID=147949 RepID=UPI001E8E96F1|nr:protein LBH-like [Micropterus dolomieu]